MRWFIYLFVPILSSLLSADSMAQQPFYKDYQVFHANGIIYITCTITQGNTCNGITLYRSEDSIYFNPIDEIAGVCGSTAFDQKYTFTDENPIANSRSWYKLFLGGEGYTEALGIDYYGVSEGYVIRNLGQNQFQLYFSNDLKNRFRFNLYTTAGQRIRSEETEADNVIIQSPTLPGQLFIFELINLEGAERFTGKLGF